MLSKKSDTFSRSCEGVHVRKQRLMRQASAGLSMQSSLQQ